MTDLQLALKRYTERAQFHDQPLLDAVIAAAQGEVRTITESEVHTRCPHCKAPLVISSALTKT